MTFVIAQITDEDGTLSLVADTKVTVTHEETATRQIYTKPCQKVVILDDDLVAGFAGDTPSTAIRHLTLLRGKSASDVVDSLTDYTAEAGALRGVSKSFLIAKRAPEPRLWTVSNGHVEDRTPIGTAWIGDPAAHRSYTGHLHGMPSDFFDKNSRFVNAARTVIEDGHIPTVGGYMVRVTGTTSHPFRFTSDPGVTAPWFTEATITTSQDGMTSMRITVPPDVDPTGLTRIPIPGEGPTFSALAHYIPEVNTALLHTHDNPSADPVVLRVESILDLLDVAASQHGQHLTMPTPTDGLQRAWLGLEPLT